MVSADKTFLVLKAILRLAYTRMAFKLYVEFHIGQKYNSLRDGMAGVADEITTTLTTQGYLSDGNSHSLVINGQVCMED